MHRLVMEYQELHMECCGNMLTWMGNRMPNFCPECGSTSIGAGKKLKATVLICDQKAMLMFRAGAALVKKD